MEPLNITTTYDPKGAATAAVASTQGAKMRRVSGGWKVIFPDGREELYMNRTTWFRKG